jgi:carbon-monoxide dehydrogenase medium subunit
MTADGYIAPASVDEAVALLAKNPKARLLAGGHNLLVEPGRRTIAGSLLVDLGRIKGLAGVDRQADGSLKIGSMTTLSQLAESDAVRSAYPALVDAVLATGDAQFRNRATVGGSLAVPDPEAPLPALMLALNALYHVTGPAGARTGAPGKPIQAEVITAVTLSAPEPRSGLGYAAFRNPATLHAACAVAASVALGSDGTVAGCRVAVTGAASVPQRLAGVEQALAGKKPEASVLSAAAGAAGAGLTFRGDLFASSEYRAHLTRVLTGRALKQAIERAAR